MFPVVFWCSSAPPHRCPELCQGYREALGLRVGNAVTGPCTWGCLEQGVHPAPGEPTACLLPSCEITTREYCEFMHGYFHEEATLCSQVRGCGGSTGGLG